MTPRYYVSGRLLIFQKHSETCLYQGATIISITFVLGEQLLKCALQTLTMHSYLFALPGALYSIAPVNPVAPFWPSALTPQPVDSLSTHTAHYSDSHDYPS